MHRFLFLAAETSGFGDFGDFSTIPVATGGGGSSSAAPFADFSSFPSQPQQPPPTAPQSDIFADFSSHPMQPSQTTVSTRFPFLYTISPLSLSFSLFFSTASYAISVKTSCTHYCPNCTTGSASLFLILRLSSLSSYSRILQNPRCGLHQV